MSNAAGPDADSGVMPVLPPILASHPVDPECDPFAHAMAGAGKAEFRAGDVVWSRAQDRLAAAIVLEPTVSPSRCPEMLFLTMVAVVEALGACVRPELALTHRWPARLLANGGEFGRVRICWSDALDEDGAPFWLVIGVEIQIAEAETAVEPGEIPGVTSLAGEQAGELDRGRILEAVCRHLLSWIQTWEHDGFSPVRDAWLYRAEGYRERIAVEVSHGMVEGVFLGLDGQGNLLLKEEGPIDGTRVVMLDAALAEMETL